MAVVLDLKDLQDLRVCTAESALEEGPELRDQVDDLVYAGWRVIQDCQGTLVHLAILDVKA